MSLFLKTFLNQKTSGKFLNSDNTSHFHFEFFSLGTTSKPFLDYDSRFLFLQKLFELLCNETSNAGLNNNNCLNLNLVILHGIVFSNMFLYNNGGIFSLGQFILIGIHCQLHSYLSLYLDYISTNPQKILPLLISFPIILNF